LHPSIRPTRQAAARGDDGLCPDYRGIGRVDIALDLNELLRRYTKPCFSVVQRHLILNGDIRWTFWSMWYEIDIRRAGIKDVGRAYNFRWVDIAPILPGVVEVA